MKAPAFWYRTQDQSSLIEKLMAPLSLVYQHFEGRNREHSNPDAVPVPVICLGNLVAGGSGKTPTAIALMKLLREQNIFLSPGFLTRGYNGKIKFAERVDASNDPRLWGDEALLLQKHAPTFVSPNRAQGANLMVLNGCDVILMDDGLQNYSLKKDVSFAIIDGRMGFGNGKVIPAGPLRQPLEAGLAIPDAFILIGQDFREVASRLPADKPVFKADIKIIDGFTLPKTSPYVAFCGIGFPEKFKVSLQEAGADLVGWNEFGDHHSYTIEEMDKLVNEALEKKARLITTEKDFVRLPDFSKKTLIDILPIEVIFEEPDKLIKFVKTKTLHKSKP